MNTMFYYNKLFLKIIVIAYKDEGESIFFYINNGEEIVYSGLVDSYQNDDNKYIQEVLSSLGISKLDFLCWSHPHDDHSMGMMEILRKYVGKNTKIVYPESLLSIKEKYLSENSKNTINLLQEINRTRINGKNRPKIMIACESKTIEKINFGENHDIDFEFRIESVAPIDNIIQNLRVKDIKKINLNDYSIFLVIRFGEYNILLTSDIEKRSITRIAEYLIPEKVDFLKVPHHGSDSSTKLIDFAIDNSKDFDNSIACVTKFKRDDLPKIDSLNKYNEFCNELFYCNPEREFEHGAFSIRIDLIRDRLEKETRGIFSKFSYSDESI